MSKMKYEIQLKKTPHQQCRCVSYIFHNIDLCNNMYYIHYNDIFHFIKSLVILLPKKMDE